MKKTLLLLLVFPFVFASCSDSDDEKAEKALVGTWKNTRDYGEVVTDNEELTKEIEEDLSWTPDEGDSFFHIFHENGTYEWVSDFAGEEEYNKKGKYSISGNKLIFTFMSEDVENVEERSFNLKDDVLHIVLEDQTKYYQNHYKEHEEYKDAKISKVLDIEEYKKQ